MEKINFTQINNDSYGNPRYVCHFTNLMTQQEKDNMSINPLKGCYYNDAVKRANKIGGRRFHNKQYGGGIVFQSYNTEKLQEQIHNLIK